MTRKIAALVVAVQLFAFYSDVRGATWTIAGGSAWGTGTNWSPATSPNATGAQAIFNGAATGSNAAQAANRTITLGTAQTVGSLILNNDLSTFTNSFSTDGSMIFDEVGAGPATMTTMGAGTGNNTLGRPMTLTDSLVATVNNTTATSAAGSLNLTGTIDGPGGFTKSGLGMATFGTGAKTYTGDTVLNGGRTRVSFAARPQNTSSLTINAGAQLAPISAGDFTFSNNAIQGPLNLNGTGLGAGSVPGNFPGAIRADTNLAVSFSNPVVLQSDTLLHVQGSATGAITLNGVVSGPGKLSLTAPGSDANLGKLALTGANTYAGGTLVNGGTLEISGANATLGTGNVSVLSGGAMFAGAVAKLSVLTGVSNAINDFATLSLAGSVTPDGIANDGYADLGAGINDIVSGLVLGGIPKFLTGTYGSSGSGATYQFDEFFAGTGVVTLVPEPGSFTLLGLLFATVSMCLRCRKR